MKKYLTLLFCGLAIFVGISQAEEKIYTTGEKPNDSHLPPLCFEAGYMSKDLSVQISGPSHYVFKTVSTYYPVKCITKEEMSTLCPNPEVPCTLNADVKNSIDLEGLGTIDVDLKTNTIKSITTRPTEITMTEINTSVVRLSEV